MAVTLAAGSNELDVYLMGDDWQGNKAMDTNSWLLYAPDASNVLELFHLSGLLSNSGGVVSLPSVSQPMLAPDTLYWLVLSASHPNSEIRWFGAAEELAPKPALIAERYSHKPDPLWEVSLSPGGPGFAFRITGTPVPEPGSIAIWLGATGAMLLAGRRRRGALGQPRAWVEVPSDRA